VCWYRSVCARGRVLAQVSDSARRRVCLMMPASDCSFVAPADLSEWRFLHCSVTLSDADAARDK